MHKTSTLTPKSVRTKLRTTHDNANDTVVTSRVADKSGLDIELGHHNVTTQGCWLDQHINCTTCTYMYPPTHALTHPHIHTYTPQLRTKFPDTKCLGSLVDPHQKVLGSLTQSYTAHDAHLGTYPMKNESNIGPCEPYHTRNGAQGAPDLTYVPS